MSQAGRHQTPRAALSALRAGRLARAYVLWGDSYLVQQVLAAIRQAALPAGEDFDLVRMDGGSATPADLAAAVRTAPFAGGRRLVIVERARFLRPRSGSPGRSGDDLPAGGDAPGALGWEQALSGLPAEAVLVLLPEGAPDSRLRVVKVVSSYGGMVECGASGREGQALAAEVVRETAAQLGLRLDWRAQTLLLATVGTACGALVQELHKLSLYCGERPVTAAEVLRLCPRTAEADIWQLLDAVEAGEPGQALRIAQAALGRGESPVALVASLASQVRIMARARERTLAGVPPRALSEALGANRFWVEQSLRRAQHFSLEALYRCLQELARLDLAIKTGQLEPEPAVETFVLGLAAARSRATAG